MDYLPRPMQTIQLSLSGDDWVKLIASVENGSENLYPDEHERIRNLLLSGYNQTSMSVSYSASTVNVLVPSSAAHTGFGVFVEPVTPLELETSNNPVKISFSIDIARSPMDVSFVRADNSIAGTLTVYENSATGSPVSGCIIDTAPLGGLQTYRLAHAPSQGESQSRLSPNRWLSMQAETVT